MSALDRSEEILELLEMHSRYIQDYDRWLRQIRYVYVLAISGLIAHFYSNGCTQNITWYFCGTLVISSLCYFSEAPVQYWQGNHYNLAYDLYDRLKSDLALEDNPFPYKRRAKEKKFISRVLWTILDMPATTLFYSTVIIISSLFLFGILEIKANISPIFPLFWIIFFLIFIWNFFTLFKDLICERFENSKLSKILE
jgi:hypothetical protein